MGSIAAGLSAWVSSKRIRSGFTFYCRLAARHYRPTAQTLQKCKLCEISRQRFGVTSLSARLKNDSLFLSEDYTEGVSLSLGSSDTQVCHAGDEFADSGGARAAGRFSSNGDPKNSPGAKPFSHGRFHTRDAGARIGSLGETLQSMGRSAPQDLIVTVHG